MIDQFYADNQLYLQFLNIEKDDIPLRKNNVDQQEFYKLVESKFRKLVRTYHPDYGGDAKDFEFLLQSKKKLLETNNEDRNFFLQFDDNRFEFYDKNSLAAKLGNQIFECICEWGEDLNIKPIYKPENSLDVYEWIFQISENDSQLSLNIQNFDKDLYELPSNQRPEDQLSLLICLFIPSTKLSPIINEINNSINLQFNDLIFLESSNSRVIKEYFKNCDCLKKDLEDFRNNRFKSKFQNELKLKKSTEAIDKDKKLFTKLQNLKIFNTNYNEDAADFIDSL